MADGFPNAQLAMVQYRCRQLVDDICARERPRPEDDPHHWLALLTEGAAAAAAEADFDERCELLRELAAQAMAGAACMKGRVPRTVIAVDYFLTREVASEIEADVFSGLFAFPWEAGRPPVEQTTSDLLTGLGRLGAVYRGPPLTDPVMVAVADVLISIAGHAVQATHP